MSVSCFRFFWIAILCYGSTVSIPFLFLSVRGSSWDVRIWRLWTSDSDVSRRYQRWKAQLSVTRLFKPREPLNIESNVRHHWQLHFLHFFLENVTLHENALSFLTDFLIAKSNLLCLRQWLTYISKLIILIFSGLLISL